MRRGRRLEAIPAALLAAAFVLGTALPAPADARDIAVGGVFVCRITHDAPGYTSYQRAVEVTRRITRVLSNPRFRRGAVVAVRTMGPDATITVGGVLVFTVMPDDTDGKTTTVVLARRWAQLLAQGLSRALPGAGFYF